MFEKIKKWYHGEDKVYESSNSSVLALSLYTDRHWTASFTQILVKFYFNHWKWLWGMGVTLTLAYIKLR